MVRLDTSWRTVQRVAEGRREGSGAWTGVAADGGAREGGISLSKHDTVCGNAFEQVTYVPRQ